MRRLVYAFYDHGFSFRKLLNRYPQMKDDTTDCLTGDLFRNFDELYAAVSDFAKVPDALSHGRPYVPEVAHAAELVSAGD
jgi:hypothetical protein